MVRSSPLKLNETREERERESFLQKIFLGQSPRKSSFHPGKIQRNSFSGKYTPCAVDERSKFLHIVLV